MSAYIVSDNCINTIVSAAIDLTLIEMADGQQWAQILATENARSVNYRYSENSEFPIVFEYSAVTMPLTRAGAGRNFYGSEYVRSVEDLIGELRYQSCEHNEWDASAACRFLELLGQFIVEGPAIAA